MSENSDTPTKRVSIKFLFKNEVEHTYVLQVPNDDIGTLQDFLIKGAKNDWILIPDSQEKGRFCLVKTEEVVCIQTTM